MAGGKDPCVPYNLQIANLGLLSVCPGTGRTSSDVCSLIADDVPATGLKAAPL